MSFLEILKLVYIWLFGNFALFYLGKIIIKDFHRVVSFFFSLILVSGPHITV